MTKDPVLLRNEFTERILSHDYLKGPLLILAGPGTGKTYSLRETIRVQMAKGIRLEEFYVTTLTNAAAGDFEDEVKSKISINFDNVSTLHFRAKGIVHLYADKVGLNSSFLVLNDLETKCLLREIQHMLSVGKKITAKEVGALFAGYEKELANNQIITRNDFAIKYQELKSFYNVISWYEVPYYAYKILIENEDVQQKEVARQLFVLVDEYQDLNRADQDLIQLISKNSRLLVVGDDDQSIYGGRCADPSGIVNFSSRYAGTERIILPVCSRCPTVIIKAANNLISRNDPEKRVVKPELIALPDTDKNADGGYIASVGLRSSKEETEFLAAAIKTIIKNNPIVARDIMVLCSSRDLGLELISAFSKNHSDIPIDDKLTKDKEDISCIVVNYLKRFLNRNNDNLALHMFLTLFLKISPKIYLIIFNIAKDNYSLWEALQKGIDRKELRKEKLGLERFINIVNSTAGKTIEEKLKVFSKEYSDLKLAIERLIESSSTDSEFTGDEEQRSVKSVPFRGVQFMTMHRSKGLDAKYVFIPFMEQELRLPARDLEEQRRLLYVALTRAKISVLITWAFSRKSASRHKAGGGYFIKRNRSNFINECGISEDTPPQDVLGMLLQVTKIPNKEKGERLDVSAFKD